ncbi:hypothetical protein BY458DRAFT_500614 [Sporodiniella umbellata]|nr:hypothetical protein BY458DRAFT_500614 [Sporodiniella umbellata]
MCWSHLPSEITCAILKHLDSIKSVSQCQLVCKNWSVTAQRVLYENLYFVEADNVRMKNFILSLKRQSDERGRLTRTVHFSFACTPDNIHYDFSLVELAKACPYIEEINAFNPALELFQQITCASIFYWKHLRKIPIPSSQNFDGLFYTMCAFQLTESLQEISVSRKIFNQAFGLQFFWKLKEFKSLKTVHFLEPLRPYVLNMCMSSIPHVKSLFLVSIDDLDGSGYSYVSEPSKHIESIQGLSMPFEGPLVEYFMDKFPELKQLEMRLSFSAHDSMTRYHKHPNRFCKFIQSIPQHCVHFDLASTDLFFHLLAALEPTRLSLQTKDGQNTAICETSGGSTITLVLRMRSQSRPEAVVVENTFGALQLVGRGLERLRLHFLVDYVGDIIHRSFVFCPNLKAFECIGPECYDSVSRTPQPFPPLETFSMKAVNMNEGLFHELSPHYPHLKQLKISSDEFPHTVNDSDSPTSFDKEPFNIDMSLTHIDYLCFHKKDWNNSGADSAMNVRVFTEKLDGIVYRLDKDGLNEASDPTVFVDLYIRCKSIKALGIRLNQTHSSLLLLN